MNKLNSSFLNHLKPPLQPAATATTRTFRHQPPLIQGSHHEVIAAYSSMLKTNTPPDTYTFPNLLKACTSLNLSLYGLSFHQRIVVNGLSLDAYIASSLINLYAKFGHAQNARKVFDVMPHRNIGEVFRLLYTMRVEEMEPDKQTYASAVSVAAMQSNLKLGKSVHGQIIRTGYELDSHVETALMVMYLKMKCRNIDLAFHIFEGTKKLTGWSSIELHGWITTFFTDHNTNPQFDDIVSILKMLSKGMRKPIIDNELND